MFKRILILGLICVLPNIARSDTAITGDGRVLENPTSNGDLKFRVNVGGTRTDAISITGSTGNVSIPKGISEPITANASTGAVNDAPYFPIINLTAAATSLSGVVAQAQGTHLKVVNSSGAAITLSHNGAGSTATNRFAMPGANQITLRDSGMATFVYVSSRWMLSSQDFSAWASATPTFGNLTTSAVQFTAHRVSDTYESRGFFTTNTVSAGSCSLILPSGVTADSTKMVNPTVVGRFYRFNTTNVYSAGNDGIIFYDGTTDRVWFSFSKSSTTFNIQNCSTLFSPSEKVAVELSLPAT